MTVPFRFIPSPWPNYLIYSVQLITSRPCSKNRKFTIIQNLIMLVNKKKIQKSIDRHKIYKNVVQYKNGCVNSDYRTHNVVVYIIFYRHILFDRCCRWMEQYVFRLATRIREGRGNTNFRFCALVMDIWRSKNFQHRFFFLINRENRPTPMFEYWKKSIHFFFFFRKISKKSLPTHPARALCRR